MSHSLCIPSPIKVPSDLDEIYLPLKLVLRASLLEPGSYLQDLASDSMRGAHTMVASNFFPASDFGHLCTLHHLVFSLQHFLWDHFHLPSIPGFPLLRFSAQGACVSPYFLQRGCIGSIAIPKKICQSPTSEPVNVNLFENKIFADINKLQIFR